MTTKEWMETGLIGAYERVNIIDMDNNSSDTFYEFDRPTPVCNIPSDLMAREVYKIGAGSDLLTGPFLELYISKKIEANFNMIGGNYGKEETKQE